MAGCEQVGDGGRRAKAARDSTALRPSPALPCPQPLPASSTVQRALHAQALARHVGRRRAAADGAGDEHHTILVPCPAGVCLSVCGGLQLMRAPPAPASSGLVSGTPVLCLPASPHAAALLDRSGLPATLCRPPHCSWRQRRGGATTWQSPWPGASKSWRRWRVRARRRRAAWPPSARTPAQQPTCGAASDEHRLDLSSCVLERGFRNHENERSSVPDRSRRAADLLDTPCTLLPLPVWHSRSLPCRAQASDSNNCTHSERDLRSQGARAEAYGLAL